MTLHIAGLETCCVLCDRPWDALGRLPDRVEYGKSVHGECADQALVFALELAERVRFLDDVLAAVLEENRRPLRRAA